MEGLHCTGLYLQTMCFFASPNTSESIKHKLWDCMQARRAWRRVMFIVHELCRVRTGNYDSFHWKQGLIRERISKKFGNKIKRIKKLKIWHLLCNIALWTIRIECNDKVLNHEPKVKHCTWDELIIYAKATWEWVIKQFKISSFSIAAMLQGLDQMWGVRNVLCRRNNLNIIWNWKRQRRLVVQLFDGLFDGLGLSLASGVGLS